MAQYLVREENMERLEKKMKTLSKKFAQTYCSFTYAVTGEKYTSVKDEDGKEYTAKYYIIEASGTSQYNGWEFVATIDHHKEGNVIRAYNTTLTIPDKYKDCGPTCEHCNKIRSRKDTYLIYNAERKEFKQVGKSCLNEYTNGLSAEDVAFYASIYEKLDSYGEYSGPSYNRYVDVEKFLRYSFECFKHWGYQKSANTYSEENGYLPTGYRSTRDHAVDYMYIHRACPKEREAFEAEMYEVGFDAESEYAVNTTKAALEWIKNEEPNGEYIRNLKIIASDSYTDYRSLGILASLTIAYERHLGKVAEYEAKRKEQEEIKVTSNYLGEVKAKITVNTNDFTCVSSWESMYGPTYLYKFTDEDGNVCVWYASKSIDNADSVISVTGTVKNHSEYNGVKQTVLTRCRVAY